MGSVGLTLPWEHKLSSVARDGERRVEPFEGKTEPVRTSEELSQDAERPGDEGRLSAKPRDAALNFQEGFLHGVFGIGRRAEKIAREIFHARALPLVETFVALQVSAEAGRRHGRVLGKFFADSNGSRFPFERLHSPLPVARHC